MSPWRRVEISVRKLEDGSRLQMSVHPTHLFVAARSVLDLDNPYDLRAEEVQVGDILLCDGKACYVSWVDRRDYTPKVPRGTI